MGELKDTVRINGFRPGKVPVGHLKRLYGRSVMAEAIEAAVRDANAQIVSENNLRLANMDWEDFATAVDGNGIHRGFG